MINDRRLRLLEKVNNQSVIIVFSGVPKIKTADQHYDFFVNNNFFYLTNLEEDNMALVMIKSANQAKQIIFKEFRSPERALWDGELLSVEATKELSMVDEVRDIKELDQFINQVTSSTRGNVYGKITQVYLDLESSDLASSSYLFVETIKKDHPYLQINSISFELANLRMIKDENEVAQIKKAIDITNLGLENIMKNLKPGTYEFEMDAHFKHTLNLHNTTPSFNTIAAGGGNATVLHYIDNNTKLEDNSLILFDLGAYYGHYAADISRTFPVNGKFSPRQREIYELVLKTNKETIKFLKPGVTWKEFNEFAINILTEGLIKLGLVKEYGDLRKYYYHSIGHFLGLDVHDIGNYQVPLSAGMIVTVEPGIYIKEEGIGIRIEDDILITETGSINLSAHIIKEIHDIEDFMKK